LLLGPQAPQEARLRVRHRPGVAAGSLTGSLIASGKSRVTSVPRPTVPMRAPDEAVRRGRRPRPTCSDMGGAEGTRTPDPLHAMRKFVPSVRAGQTANPGLTCTNANPCSVHGHPHTATNVTSFGHVWARAKHRTRRRRDHRGVSARSTSAIRLATKAGSPASDPEAVPRWHFLLLMRLAQNSI
jgi:hypothetical protein